MVRKDTVETRVAWEGRSWRLNVLSYLLPDGTVKERGVIDHPGSVLIVPFENNQVLMLRQFRLTGQLDLFLKMSSLLALTDPVHLHNYSDNR